MAKIPNKILIASNNQGKIREISELISHLEISALAPKDCSALQNLQEPAEDGQTFAENSLIKAKFYGQKSQLPALADDSGFCVVDLNNEPGIYSARFAINDNGEKDFPGAFNKIFNKLKQKDIDINSAKAFFICNLTYYNPATNFAISFEGRVDGTICQPIGNKGFGYDPIFIKNDMLSSFAEINPSEKEKISHRGLAFQQFKNWLGDLKND
jgi:XTP/dITP diphosphohydrolase